MRRLILQTGISIDGYVAALDRSHPWNDGGQDKGVQRWILDSVWAAGAHLMGRVTYEEMAAVWPTSTSEYARPVAGSASVMLGGPSGRRFQVGRGDVLVLPAGTGYFNAGSSADLLVVGAYPSGMRWDLRRGDPTERDEVLANTPGCRCPRPTRSTDRTAR